MKSDYFLLALSLPYGFVLISALLLRKQNILANRLLAATIFIEMFFQTIESLRWSGAIAHHPFLVRLAFPFNLLLPALLYMYVMALTVQKYRIEKNQIIHLLPAGVGFIWYLYATLTQPQIGNWWVSPEQQIERYDRLIVVTSLFGFYLFPIFLRLREFSSEAVHFLSDARKIKLRWLKFLYSLYLVVWIVTLIDVFTGPSITFENILMPLLTLNTLLIGLFGLRESAVFDPRTLSEETKTKPPTYTESELAEWKSKIEEWMEQNKPYLELEFRLQDLAEGLGVKAYQASELLNRSLGMTFFDFANRYRVEEAKKRLCDPAFSHMNILGIATESGFNSKSAFNESFKRITGTTPSYFRAEKRL